MYRYTGTGTWIQVRRYRYAISLQKYTAVHNLELLKHTQLVRAVVDTFSCAKFIDYCPGTLYYCTMILVLLNCL
eukprot:SAG11_NODE_547_length_8604_cov_4.710641_5_plen_74_part_00